MLFGSETPYVRLNSIGGSWFGHYSPEQLPMAGMHNVEIAQDKLMAAQLQGTWHMTTNNYIVGAGGILFDHDRLKHLFRSKPIYGMRAGWYYRTVLGPIGASVNYNTRQKEVSLFFNIGYFF